jgi:minor extracellular serine protease Vpr
MDHHALGTRSRMATVLLTATLVSLPTLLQAGNAPVKRSASAQFSELHGRAVGNPQQDIEVFVRLDQPSVAELNVEAVRTTGEFASTQDQKAQAARVSQQQAAISDSLAGHGATILSRQRVGANGLRIKVKASEIENLRAMPGVRSVGRVEIHKLDNVDSVPWIGAPAVWSSLGRGEGVKVGIIDSGIDYTHATFGGSGSPADHAANNPTVIEPGTFPTAKVKGGIDFAGSNYDASSDDPVLTVPQPDPDPIDYGPGGGHGTHVAGTAAGIGVPGSVGSGVAPGASLYAIKVFGDSAGSTNLTSLGIEWAMDPNGDGDMSDHLDVINMSLGAAFGNPDDPSAISSQNAADLGIIVVASAGNEGQTPYVTGAPAVAAAAISVAASKPGGNHLYSRFTVTAPASLAGTYESEEGGGPVTLAQTGPISGALVLTDPANGCTPLANAAAVSGKIALVVRGTCNFIVKYQQAAAAGAKALVVYNDGTNPTRIHPIIMAADGATIPGIMIDAAIGAALAAAPAPAATLQAAPDADAISSFSSLGPGGGGSLFKPDLSAPGERIVSAGMGTGTGSLQLDGTSMAAPHVAGAAALLRQKHPKLDQSAIKALLQNSTVPASVFGDTRVTRTGVGVVRVDRAAALSSYASPGGISFGRLNPVFPVEREQRVKLTNLSGKSRNYSVRHIANRTYPGVKVECPSSVRVNSKGSTRFAVELKFDPRKAFKQGVFDDAFSSQAEVDGWCVLNDGKDTLRVAYIAVVDAASAVLTLPGRKLQSVNLLNVGPALGIAEGFTLAKLGGEVDEGRTAASISAVGFRNANPALFGGLPTLEFGIALGRSFEHLSTFEFDLLIDTNGDGAEDVILVGVDLSAFQDVDPGAFVTAQFLPSGAGFIDWFVGTWDHNDRTLILPFTLEDGGGLLPPKFDYTLITFAGDGTQDVQQGSVDLAKEIVPDLNSFGIDPGGNVNVGMTGPTGYSLWLLQNDIPLGQVGLSFTVAPKN